MLAALLALLTTLCCLEFPALVGLLAALGSGSTAFATALHATELGKTVAMTEERTVGGTCANRGCLPSKNLIEAEGVFSRASSRRSPPPSRRSYRRKGYAS